MIAAWFALSGALWGARPVVVAIVDDGFETESEPAREFWTDSVLARNLARPALAPWDVSDADADVRPPSSRSREFWHGTAVANLLALRLGQYLGPGAAKSVRFVALKALSDRMVRADMSDGYAAIERATRAGADVVLCPWAGGVPGEDARRIVGEAISKGILVVAAAGNEATRRPQFPASLPGVVSVAAIDSRGRRMALSCRGDWISLAAPGDTVRLSTRPLLPETLGLSQTSRAAAEVAALVAALKVRHPGWNSDKIRHVLAASSSLLEPGDPRISGTLGAGAMDPVHAFLGDWEGRVPSGTDGHPAGLLPLSRRGWNVDLSGAGGYTGVRLHLTGSMDPKSRVSAVAPDGHRYDWSRQDLLDGVEAPYPSLRLEWKGSKRPGGFVEFRKLGLDSSTLFCRGTRELSGDSGRVSDGSGPHPYAHECDCRWIVRVAAGDRIRLEFDTFRTASNLDLLHLYHGTGTLPENLLAMFSGPRPPPPFTTPGNEALLWFPSSSTGAGDGFSVRWRAVPGDSKVGLDTLSPQDAGRR